MPGKVLIIDDIATNRITFKVRLAAACYQVAQAATAAEGLTLARQMPPDLILCPANLPDMDAAGLARALRGDPLLEDIPLIVVTADHDPATRLAMLEAGADDILLKPLSDDLFLARLRSLLRHRHNHEEKQLRDGAGQVLGLAETPAGFDAPGRVLLVADTADTALKWKSLLARSMPDRLTTVGIADAMRHIGRTDVPDAIGMVLPAEAPETGLRLLTELTAHPATRDAGVIVALAAPRARLAAEALDRGAAEVLGNGALSREMALRLRRQILRKRRIETLRRSMRAGLRAAVIDPLTGLHNRRYAMPRLARMVEEAARIGRDCAVMVVDIDHFKMVNDTFGHAAGDAVLSRIGQILRKTMGPDALVARLGGEEFLIAMPDTGPEIAHMAAQRLCRLIAGTLFRIPGQPRPVRITVSIGVALASDPAPRDPATPRGNPASPTTMLERADRALYGAKAHGRNRVTFCKRRPAA